MLVDAFRFVGSIAIVWLHIAGDPSLEWSKALARFAVPFFAAGAVFFAFDHADRRDISLIAYGIGRIRRIYLLFLAWSVIYWIARSFSAIALDRSGLVQVSPLDFFWNGIAIQLWFLPFILCATVAAFLLGRSTRGSPAARVASGFACAAAGIWIGVAAPPPLIVAAGYGASLGYATLPACLWTASYALLFSAPVEQGPLVIRSVPIRVICATVGLGLFIGWAFITFERGRYIAWENAAGLGLFVAAMQWNPKKAPWLHATGAIAFGIYLVHALFVEGAQHLMPKLGLVVGLRHDVVILVFSLVASVLAVITMRLWRWSRWLAG